jgi:hypothetical protein
MEKSKFFISSQEQFLSFNAWLKLIENQPFRKGRKFGN